MPAPRTTLLTLGILAALALPLAAEASIKIAGNASNPSLRVNARGVATVTWTKNGRHFSAVVTRSGRVRYLRRAPGRDVSVPSSAVALPMLVMLRQTPDGRLWALQSWRRLRTGPVELRLSRWRGAPTTLAFRTQCCKWRSEVVRGRASYHGRPIIGFRWSRQGAPLDRFGRVVYIDSFRRGSWMRLMGVAARRPAGQFLLWIRPHWRGASYRARITGPNWGQTLAPDVEAWAASSL